jgi:hypothetical protein
MRTKLIYNRALYIAVNRVKVLNLVLNLVSSYMYTSIHSRHTSSGRAQQHPGETTKRAETTVCDTRRTRANDIDAGSQRWPQGTPRSQTSGNDLTEPPLVPMSAAVGQLPAGSAAGLLAGSADDSCQPGGGKSLAQPCAEARADDGGPRSPVSAAELARAQAGQLGEAWARTPRGFFQAFFGTFLSSRRSSTVSLCPRSA